MQVKVTLSQIQQTFEKFFNENLLPDALILL